MPSITESGELKVYRPPIAALVPAFAVAGVWFIIGLSGVTVGGASGAVVGGLLLLFSFWLMASLATNRLTVTAAGLVYQNNLRRKVLNWPEIQSFGVGPTRGMMRWPGLVIHRTDGSRLVTTLASYAPAYPGRIADELTGWQRKLAPTTLEQQA